MIHNWCLPRGELRTREVIADTTDVFEGYERATEFAGSRTLLCGVDTPYKAKLHSGAFRTQNECSTSQGTLSSWVVRDNEGIFRAKGQRQTGVVVGHYTQPKQIAPLADNRSADSRKRCMISRNSNIIYVSAHYYVHRELLRVFHVATMPAVA